MHDPVHNSAPTKAAQSSCFQVDSYSQAWTPFRKCHDFVTTQHDCLLFWHLHIFHVRRRRGGERWRIPETQVGVTFQGPPPVLRQWIHRPQRRKSPRRLTMWLPTRRSSDQTPALMDGARVCFIAPLAFEASAHSCWLSLQAASLARQHIRSWHSAISSLFIWSDYWFLSHMESTWTTVWSFCSGQM